MILLHTPFTACDAQTDPGVRGVIWEEDTKLQPPASSNDQTSWGLLSGFRLTWEMSRSCSSAVNSIGPVGCSAGGSMSRRTPPGELSATLAAMLCKRRAASARASSDEPEAASPRSSGSSSSSDATCLSWRGVCVGTSRIPFQQTA